MTLRWGVMGTGFIAEAFTRDLARVDAGRMMAVGSRTHERAAAFAARNGIPRAYGRYEDLVLDPEVDVVYVATPHVFHAEHARMALLAGKPVLCEKPFAMSAAEGRAVFDLARERGLFCMEALWTRHFPATLRLRQLLDEGELGPVRALWAEFCIRAPLDPSGRLWSPELGGGALLDLGIYPVALAHFVFRARPADLVALGHWTGGIDAQSAFVLRWPQGQLASLLCSLEGRSGHAAEIIGERGSVFLPDFFHPRQLELRRGDDAPRRYDFADGTDGWGYQAVEVRRCLAAGELESPVMPWAETLAIADTLDRLRGAMGLDARGPS